MAEQPMYIGKNFTPPDVVAKVTGQAKYAEDFRAEGMLYAKLLLSPMPHARVRRIDAREALRMPGVHAVITHEDVPKVQPGMEPILAEEAMYVGEPIAAVVADDELTAAEAIERIKLDMQPLPHVTDPLDSLRPGGPNASSHGNVVASGIPMQTIKWTARDFLEVQQGRLPMAQAAEEWSYGDVDAALAEADLVLDETFVTQPISHHSMETRSCMAYWQNGRCYLHGSIQSLANAHPLLAELIGIEPENLVFISENTGGGFGSKIRPYPQLAIPAILSKKVGGRPVMLRVTRAEEFYFGRSRPGFQGRVKIGFRKDGRITAVDLFIVQANGPYATTNDFRSAGNAVSIIYQPENMRHRAVPVITNTATTSAQRGPGENQIAAVMEPLMDEAARQLGIDPVVLRQINAPDKDGKVGPNRDPLTSAYLREALEIGAKEFNWEEKKKLNGQRRGSKVRGVGIGTAYHSAGSAGFDGLLIVKPDGKLYIHSGEGNLGTFSFAGTARTVAETLKMPWDQVVIVWGRTDRDLPWTVVQAGSNTTYTMSRAKYAAAMDLKAKLQEIAAMDLGGSPGDYDVADGRVFAKDDPSRALTFAQAAQRAIELGGKYSGHELPGDLHEMTVRSARAIAGQGLIGVARDNLPKNGVTPALAAAFVEVEVDLETGGVEVLEYVGVSDCGIVVHPKGLATQIFGGAVQGFGMARYERHIYDPHLGMPGAKGLYTTKPPTILDVPLHMRWAAVNKPDESNPFGAKGIGEPVLGAAAAAYVSAVSNALGTRFNRMPILPDMIINYVENQPQSYKPLEVLV